MGLLASRPSFTGAWSLPVTALMKSVLAALVVLLWPTACFAEDEARLAAVLSYADWCASCRVLDPKIEEARAETRFEGVRFVTLDYTDRQPDAYFDQADAAEVGAAVRVHFSDRIRTGMLLLIDLDDGQVVGEVRRDASVQDLTYQIWRAAAQA